MKQSEMIQRLSEKSESTIIIYHKTCSKDDFQNDFQRRRNEKV